MTLPEHCVTCFPRSLRSAHDAQPLRRGSVLAALTLALGGVICAPVVLAQSAPVLAGKWQLACTGRRGEVRQIPLEIEQQGATLSGSYDGARRSGQLHGSVQGNQVSFELAGNRGSASFTGTIDGNTLQVHTAKGISCTGTRQ
jgi:hypothetical protein